MCDVPEDINKVKMEHFVTGFESIDLETHFSNSLEEDEGAFLKIIPWYFKDLPEEALLPIKERYLRDNSPHHEILADEILKVYPARIEPSHHLHKRVTQFKTFLTEYTQQNSEQVVLVGHSSYFTYFTAEDWPVIDAQTQSYDYSKPMTKYKFLANCEFHPADSHVFSKD